MTIYPETILPGMSVYLITLKLALCGVNELASSPSLSQRAVEHITNDIEERIGVRQAHELEMGWFEIPEVAA